jgi:hypothetical protein
MTTFVWTINALSTLPQVDGQPDVVVNSTYTVTGSENGTVTSIRGMQQFTYTGGAFTPFDQLTQDQVVGWVQAALTQPGIDNLYAAIQGQITYLANPPPVPAPQPLPWVA